MASIDITAHPDIGSHRDSKCAFCRELEHGSLAAELAARTRVTKRFVLDAEHWVAFPSVSPLRLGHLLVVPRRHICSCAQANATERAELDALTAELSAKLQALGDETLVFEHGVGKGRSGGCGIDHAHLHVVPGSSAERRHATASLTAELDWLEPSGSLSECLGSMSSSSSYALVGTVEDVSCHASHTIASQTLRRAVGAAVGCSTWDWRDLTDWSTYESTYAQLA